MSKYACEAFSDGLRYEMPPWGVSVHIIEPGMFATQILDTDFLIKQWKELWDTLSTEKRASYGTEYLEKSKILFLFTSITYLKPTDPFLCFVLTSSKLTVYQCRLQDPFAFPLF